MELFGILLCITIVTITVFVYKQANYSDKLRWEARNKEIDANLEASLAETEMKAKAVEQLKEKIKLEISTQDIAKIFGENDV